MAPNVRVENEVLVWRTYCDGGAWEGWQEEPAGRDLRGEQQHSFLQGGCQLCSSPAQGLARGAAPGAEEPHRGDWPQSRSSRKTSNCSGSTSQGPSGVRPQRGPGGKGKELDDEEQLYVKPYMGKKSRVNFEPLTTLEGSGGGQGHSMDAWTPCRLA